jgi:hypothetical protein
MKKKSSLVVLGLVTLLLAVASGTAWGNDQIASEITIPAGQPVPIIEPKGVTPGNIMLTYTWVASSCSTGQFAQFNLNLSDQLGSGRQRGVYPAILSLEDSGGGTAAQLSASPASLNVTGVGWTGSSLVTVSISKCDTFQDGATLDGQMQESASLPLGGNPFINTQTTIHVHIKVVVPKAACLNLYSFESDQDTGDLLTSLVVNAKTNGSIKATNPGQISVDGLVANTCLSELSFDLGIGIGFDHDWGTNPSGNPGNATFTYTTTGEYDPSTYNLAAFGTGTKQGEILCLSNVTLAAGDSFLTRVHSAILSGLTTSNLPNLTAGNFTFSATIYAPGTSCLTAFSPPSIVGPSNPATSLLSYTVK